MTDCAQCQVGEGRKIYDIAQIGLWYGCNYGAILTTYALYRQLEEMGKHVLLLNQAPLTHNPLYLDTGNISYRFMERHGVECSAPLQRDEELMALNGIAETFIVGSDQVWRWRYSSNQGLFYFLDFVRGDKRKIAFSSSFGVDTEERPEPHLYKARYYLQAFDAISVREKSGVNILEQVYGVHGVWLPDPVFLHGVGFYDELIQNTPQADEPYLFAYVLEMTPEISALVNTAAAEKGLKVRVIEDGQRKSREQTDSAVPEPEEWLGEIAHCSYMVTDSFHGVCFAHIYNKDFLCIAPVERGRTRFESLLAWSGLTERLISDVAAEGAKAVMKGKIDWAAVNCRLDEGRATALNWLQSALNARRDPARICLGNLAYEMLYQGQGECDRYIGEAELAAKYVRQLVRALLPACLSAKVFLYGVLARFLPQRQRAQLNSRRAALRRVAHRLANYR